MLTYSFLVFNVFNVFLVFLVFLVHPELGVIGEELHSAYILTGVRLPLANFLNKSEEKKSKKRYFRMKINTKNLIEKRKKTVPPRFIEKNWGNIEKKCFKRK